VSIAMGSSLCAGSALARTGTVDTARWNDRNLSPPCPGGEAFPPHCDERLTTANTHHTGSLVKLRYNFLPELQKSVDNL